MAGAISIDNALELEKILNQLLNDDEELKERGEAARNYVYKNAGATKKIIAVYSEKPPSYQLIKLFYNGSVSFQPILIFNSLRIQYSASGKNRKVIDCFYTSLIHSASSPRNNSLINKKRSFTPIAFFKSFIGSSVKFFNKFYFILF